MSSEGTMSIMGSEVMPLEYGGMDSESSPSPSSSERTVEERREQEGVEEEEEEIPSSIMEVGGNVGGCYDPELDIVFKVRGYVSELGSRSSLRGLVKNCNLPHHILIKPAGVNERACSAPQDHWMPMYVHYLAAELRFPIPELLVGLLLEYGIRITQLTPNAIGAGGKGEKGWYYFAPRLSSKENRSLFTAGPSSIKGWKEKFFFVDDTKWIEEVEKLVREEGDLVDIMYLTSAEAIKAAKLYEPSSLSEDGRFYKCCWRVGYPQEAKEEVEDFKCGRQGGSRERTPVQHFCSSTGDAVEARAYGEEHLFDASNITGVKRFLNATLSEVDRRQARDEAMSQLGARVVRHSLESASWVNALAHEYAESVRDCASLQRQCEELQKEKEELQKKNKDMQRKLDEVVLTVTKLQSDMDTLSTKLVFEERKRKICEDKLDAQDKYIEKMNQGMVELKKNVNLLVHNGMEEHVGNFLNSSTFENIVNLYQLSMVILAFTDCRKKVKAQYSEVDVTTVTFGKQEEGVEEDGESLSADFRPLIKLRWERDAEGRTIFPPAFEAELVALAPSEAEVPPLPAEDEPPPPPLPIEERPPSSAD
ncbi:hypothetical protein SLEP1_g55477 [Rubroshorea leprosula]|uniref:Uncharacterized protein n=1 Tax=Rubroshorea leprosula TaxID=152421 RepID=A0AAV5MGL8_9ROSI|nr:hypothetical protein SLEP1_g55477 [Rubroshorea leprosula]